ncbi:Hsp33 family molecular chaperone HslO [Weissella oryzae]|nr:Hsp33 family molecular chaperone HslO [Weissella oryzae]
MADKLIRVTTMDGNFRAIAVDATEMMQAAAKFHDASPLGVEILGRALIGSLLVANAVLKGEERLAVAIDGHGPAGKIVVEASATGDVRGYVTNPQVTLPNLTTEQSAVASAVGTDGFLQVTKEIDFGEPFTGSVQLVTGEIADDFTYYMAKSEQIPSAVALSVKVDDQGQVLAAGGFIISTLPDADDDAIQKLEANLATFPNISAQLLDGYTPYTILEELFGHETIKLLSETDLGLFPEITKSEYGRMVETLPLEQLQAMMREDHGINIIDRFTGKEIDFNEAELASIIAIKQNEAE